MSERDRNGTGEDVSVQALARLAATAWWRTAGWTVETGLRATRKGLRAVVDPVTAVSEARDAVRDAAQQLVGATEIEERLRTTEHPIATRVADAIPTPPPPTDLRLQASEGDGRPEEAWGDLREEGRRLMRRSAAVRYVETAHPAYERILGDLAPDEGRILRLLLLGGPQPAIDVRTGGPLGLISSRLVGSGFQMIGARAGCRYPDRVPSYLNNLFRLGMIWFSRETLNDPVKYQVLEAQPEVLATIKSVRMAKIVRRSIHLTPFGIDFCRVCLALDREELAELPDHAAPEESAKAAKRADASPAPA